MNLEASLPKYSSKRNRVASIFCSGLLTAGFSCSPGHGSLGPAAGNSLDSDTLAVVGQRVLSRSKYGEDLFQTYEASSNFVKGWVDDALVAEGARAGLLDKWIVNQVERSVLARSLLERFYARANAQGAPSEAEISRITAERWFAVDRPATAKVSHFVVRIREGQSETLARQLARRISTSVHGVVDPKAFISIAKSVPSAGLEVIAESLPPMAEDGRGLQLDDQGKPVGEGPSFDPTFARAANAIESVGNQSGLVRTAFGVHVLLLEQRLPAYQMPLEQRRQAFAADILVGRARRLSEESLERSVGRNKVTVEPAFQDILEKSRVLP